MSRWLHSAQLNSTPLEGLDVVVFRAPGRAELAEEVADQEALTTYKAACVPHPHCQLGRLREVPQGRWVQLSSPTPKTFPTAASLLRTKAMAMPTLMTRQASKLSPVLSSPDSQAVELAMQREATPSMPVPVADDQRPLGASLQAAASPVTVAGAPGFWR